MIIGVLLLGIIGLLAVFSVQNVTTVSVSLMYWRFEITLPALIFVAVLLGVVVAQLVRQWAPGRNATARKP
jgi:uncharacterized integral membrane protein